MTKSRSPRSRRQSEILAYVTREGTVTSVELAEWARVSSMTIHRDIDELAGKDLLRKFHGGVSAMPTANYESSSDYRLHMYPDQKQAMAKKAVEFIEPGMAVYLDDSTSAHHVAQQLAGRGSYTVVTNYLPTLNLLSAQEDIHLIGIGGDYSLKYAGFAGEVAVDTMRSIQVDFAFMSVSAMTVDMTFHQEQSSVQMKKAILQISTRPVLLMDESKQSHTALYRVASTDAYHGIILGPGSDPEFAGALAERTSVFLADAQ